MKSKLLDAASERSYALILDRGEDAFQCLRDFAKRERLEAAHFTGIGACCKTVLGFFDWQKKDYRRIEVDEQVEIVSLVGDITKGEKPGDPPNVHAHIVVAKGDGSAMGGHLLAAEVRPTLEIVVTESPAHLQRRKDPVSGLALIDLDAG